MYNVIQSLPYLPYVFEQTGLNKLCKPRSDAAEHSISSGFTLFATHPPLLQVLDTTSVSKLYLFKFLEQVW